MANIETQKHQNDMMRKKKILDTVLFIASIVFAVLSTVLGSKFYESHLLFAGDSWALAISLLLAALMAIILVFAAEISLEEWVCTATIGIKTGLFGLVICWNVATDLIGSPQWANKIEAPVNEKTAPIESKIAAVDGKIVGILDKYSWCGKHGKGGNSHECPSTTKITTVAEIKDTHAQWGHSPEQDRVDISKLEKERATYVTQLDSETTAFNSSFKNYEDTRESARGTLKGVSVALNVLFVLFTLWRVKFKVSNDTASVEAKLKAMQEAMEALERKKDEELMEAAKDNRALREEIAATKEAKRLNMQRDETEDAKKI